jgi:hypothetical protein
MAGPRVTDFWSVSQINVAVTCTSSREGTGHQRVRLAPLAVLSPPPTLAAAQKGPGKNGENW